MGCFDDERAVSDGRWPRSRRWPTGMRIEALAGRWGVAGTRVPQAMLFFVFVRTFAWTEGLLSGSPSKWGPSARSDSSTASYLSAALALTDLTSGIVAVQAQFSRLNYAHTMRLAIPPQFCLPPIAR